MTLYKNNVVFAIKYCLHFIKNIIENRSPNTMIFFVDSEEPSISSQNKISITIVNNQTCYTVNTVFKKQRIVFCDNIGLTKNTPDLPSDPLII